MKLNVSCLCLSLSLATLLSPACHPPPTDQEESQGEIDPDRNGTADETSEPDDADGDGYSRDEGDCDDHDASTHPGAPEVQDGRDNDCDGTVDTASTATPPAEDLDGDGFTSSEGDCDGENPAVAPGLPDLADGLDNDCDGLVDEACDKVSSGCVSTCTDDYDGDGFSEEACDCHDGRADVYPSNPAPDLPNGLDDDCDGQEGEDGPSWTATPTPAPGTPGGETPGTQPNTCPTPTPAPNSPTPAPLGPSCEPEQNRCNGPCTEDNDGDGYSENDCDCDDLNAEVFPNNPRADYPDGVDTDCDGVDGESCGYLPPFDFIVFWPEDYDNDGDGYSEAQCDCRDDNPTVYPGSTTRDVPDGVDDDCDGLEGEDIGVPDTPTPTPEPGEITEACRSYGPIVCFGPCDEDDDGDGFSETECDCADFDGEAYPGADVDYIDGVDDDCDGTEGEDGEDPDPFDPENQHGPTMPVVAVEPACPTNTDDLVCVVTRDAHDLEGDPITYSYAWKVDGADTDFTTPTIPHTSTTIGETWTCLVTPSDGVHLGLAGEAQVIVSRSFFLDLTYVTAGTFVMGSPGGTICQYGNETPHNVTLTHDYWIGTTEVTQGQFEALMGFNPSFHLGCDTCPVEFMTWHQAAKFTNELSTLDGLPPCYDCSGEDEMLFCQPPANLYTCQGYRLPTEAEWEYAARGGETADFPEGGNFQDWDQCDDCYDTLILTNGSALEDWLWYCKNATESMPVGLKPPNPLGLYDIQGNIWEWCNDWWDGDSDYAGDAVDPTGAAFGEMKAARGGSWTSPPNHNQFPYRAMFPPTMGFSNRGFRIVGLAFPGEDPGAADNLAQCRSAR